MHIICGYELIPESFCFTHNFFLPHIQDSVMLTPLEVFILEEALDLPLQKKKSPLLIP